MSEIKKTIELGNVDTGGVGHEPVHIHAPTGVLLLLVHFTSVPLHKEQSWFHVHKVPLKDVVFESQHLEQSFEAQVDVQELEVQLTFDPLEEHPEQSVTVVVVVVVFGFVTMTTITAAIARTRKIARIIIAVFLFSISEAISLYFFFKLLFFFTICNTCQKICQESLYGCLYKRLGQASKIHTRECTSRSDNYLFALKIPTLFSCNDKR